jgi:NADH dehydrogenase FAD-containing subunit
VAQRTLSLYSASDAERVWAAVSTALETASATADPEQQRRLATVVVGGWWRHRRRTGRRARRDAA